jgi:hypothetical protein
MSRVPQTTKTVKAEKHAAASQVEPIAHDPVKA